MFAARLIVWFQFLTSARGFHLSVALYLLALWALRSTLFAGTGGDDAEQLIFSQRWALGYGIGNPPLFTWLTTIGGAIFGTALGVVEAIKFLSLALTYLLLYKAARHILSDEKLAALAALSPIALYPLGWDAILGFTHSITLIAAIAGFYLCLLKLADDHRWRSHLLLGLVGGLGLLTKYNFGMIALSLLIAAAFDANFRRQFTSVKFFAACLLAAMLFAPHAYWIAQHLPELALFAKDRLADNSLLNSLSKSVHGVFRSLGAALNFLLPLLIFLLVLFPKAFWQGGAQDHENSRQRNLLGRAYAILGALFVAGIVIFGIAKMRTHIFFLLILLPLYVFARIEAAGLSIKKQYIFAALIGVLALGVPVGLVAKFALYPKTQFDTNMHIPYRALAESFKAAGFKAGTIFADGYPYALGGNLHRFFPNSRIISSKHVAFRPSRHSESGQCLVVWSPHKRARDWPVAMERLANTYFQAALPPALKPKKISAETVPPSGKPFELFYYLTDGHGHCR
ncbi:MAG: glycosyltransferase family 39 protein [Proteobacteria bacterium]|nr:glycosyltransferase family 39 protein [Pseudomonadota bacterium]